MAMRNATLVEDQTAANANPLSLPPEEGVADLRRATAEYRASQRFLVGSAGRSYDAQFSAVYYARLHALRPLVAARAAAVWGSDGVEMVGKVISLRPTLVDTVVVGTLFKDMPSMPSLLKEYTAERSISGFDWAQRTTFTSDKDTLSLEDDTGRVRLLTNSADLHSVVTGAVVAVRGRLRDTGDLEVVDFLAAGAPPQPAPGPAAPARGGLVLLVSGLALGSSEQHPLATQMLVDWATGCSGSTRDQHAAARVARVVVAGDSLRETTVDEEHAGQTWHRTSAVEERSAASSLSRLDAVLASLAAGVHVDVMPGALDPATFVWPQQPLGRVLLPVASGLSTLHLVTNPHEFELGGKLFLGTSGQNVDNLEKLTTIGDRLEMMHRMLEWRHVAPTAPHTLGCYPFDEKSGDPFILERLPHVFFAGNQPEYGVRSFKGPDGSRVVCVLVPSFARTQTAVLLDLETLCATPITFTPTIAM
eukprot:m51a1_g14738 hypothetical protein (476) ;mRNA; r:277133-278945